MLHFLVDDTDRASYATLLRRALNPGGAFVIGTPGGAEQPFTWLAGRLRPAHSA